MNMNKTNICEHGRLRRVCETCKTIEQQKEINSLEKQNEMLKSALKYACDYLQESKRNSICSNSKAHAEMHWALQQCGVYK